MMGVGKNFPMNVGKVFVGCRIYLL